MYRRDPIMYISQIRKFVRQPSAGPKDPGTRLDAHLRTAVVPGNGCHVTTCLIWEMYIMGGLYIMGVGRAYASLTSVWTGWDTSVLVSVDRVLHPCFARDGRNSFSL